jgi:hypothetical protein
MRLSRTTLLLLGICLLGPQARAQTFSTWIGSLFGTPRSPAPGPGG